MKRELPPGFDPAEYMNGKKIPPEIIEAIFGTPEEVRAALEEHRCSVRMIQSEPICSQYAGEYVAIFDMRVLDHDADWRALHDRISALDINHERIAVALARLPMVEPGR